MSLYVDIEKKLSDMTLRVRLDTAQTAGVTGILGASGCGKSMTLKCIAGIAAPDAGRIVLNGRVLFDSQAHIDERVQRRRVGYLFQSFALFPRMTVRENICAAVRGSAQEKAERSARCMELLRVTELADRYPGRLSGGQQQRVALARVLASEPEVLMLDEPFSALDYYLKETLQMELLEVLRHYQGDVLLVTHSRDEVYRFCGQVHVLDGGQVVASGPTREVFENPRTVAAARLTGCKNLAKIVRTGEHEMTVPDWGLRLRTRREIPKETQAVGIRAHYLQPTGAMEAENVIVCRWARVQEDPFEVTGILDNGIWWKVSKELWQERYRRQMPEYLRVPEESLLFLTK